MDAETRTRLVEDVERWFVRRGLPHAIDDYSAREDAPTRTVPFLSLVFLAEVVTTVCSVIDSPVGRKRARSRSRS